MYSSMLQQQKPSTIIILQSSELMIFLYIYRAHVFKRFMVKIAYYYKGTVISLQVPDELFHIIWFKAN